MLVTAPVSQFVHSVIQKVWLEDIKQDFDEKRLLRERSLQCSFYYHLRRRLGEDFIEENNIQLYPEFPIGNEKADLAVVVVDPNSTAINLEDRVTEVLSIIEMKHKNAKARERCFDEDIDKIMSYIKYIQSDAMYYIAFIREKYFDPNEVINWITNEQALESNGQLTEMHSYGNLHTDEMIWNVIEY
ncbi:hypothetical protein AAAC51_07415 [Priestia megaterium]